MFSVKDLQSLDQNYFVIIVADPYDVTIMSRNTGHYWYLHNPEYPEDGTTIIFHRHHGGSTPYHLHGRASSLNRAVKSIQSHDSWQMKGRPNKKVTTTSL